MGIIAKTRGGHRRSCSSTGRLEGTPTADPRLGGLWRIRASLTAEARSRGACVRAMPGPWGHVSLTLKTSTHAGVGDPHDGDGVTAPVGMVFLPHGLPQFSACGCHHRRFLVHAVFFVVTRCCRTK